MNHNSIVVFILIHLLCLVASEGQANSNRNKIGFNRWHSRVFGKWTRSNPRPTRVRMPHLENENGSEIQEHFETLALFRPNNFDDDLRRQSKSEDNIDMTPPKPPAPLRANEESDPENSYYGQNDLKYHSNFQTYDKMYDYNYFDQEKYNLANLWDIYEDFAKTHLHKLKSPNWIRKLIQIHNRKNFNFKHDSWVGTPLFTKPINQNLFRNKLRPWHLRRV